MMKLAERLINEKEYQRQKKKVISGKLFFFFIICRRLGPNVVEFWLTLHASHTRRFWGGAFFLEKVRQRNKRLCL